MRKIIATDKAPKAIGPYSQAVRAADMIFVSGQLGLDPATGEFAGAGAVEQAERAIRNIEAILKEAGLGLSDVVKTTVILADINDFAEVNEIYAKYFSSAPPARAAYQAAALPKNARVEIEAVACAGK